MIILGIGTNIGNRYKNILNCLEIIDNKTKIINTSHIYSTSPMYVEDQNDFLNLVCIIETDLSPFDLLIFCKYIEKTLGREETIRYGPRVIDVDILFYNDININTDTLIIPHSKIRERDFVKIPLLDIGINLYEKNENIPNLPIFYGIDDLNWKLGEKTIIMGVVNRTPDSITDNNKNFNNEEAINNTIDMSKYVDIIDIGGMSTKPNHKMVSKDEEIKRVIPFIQKIKLKIKNIISIDSTKIEVIQSSINQGVKLINDVSGGTNKIFNIVKKYRINYILLCNKKTDNPKPAKFSPEDKFGKYRRLAKKEK